MSHPGSGVETPLPKFYPTIMAKKINTGENPRNETDDALQNGPAAVDETIPGAGPARTETVPPSGPEKPEEKDHTGTGTPDAPALGLLKKFPAYPSLYIDVHGGTFSPDTPASIRGKAVLYRNPFYNEPKTKV